MDPRIQPGYGHQCKIVIVQCLLTNLQHRLRCGYRKKYDLLSLEYAGRSEDWRLPDQVRKACGGRGKVYRGLGVELKRPAGIIQDD